MNVSRLIEEVRIRPALWDIGNVENKSRSTVPNLWKEVANVLGVDDVEKCKRKWKNLRDAYRALVRRSERRMERDKLIGDYNPNREYDTKWVYFDSLSFIKDNKRRRRRYSADYDQSTNSIDDIYHPKYCQIKLEPSGTRGNGVYSVDDDDDHDDDDDDMDDDIFFEEFQSITAPQQATAANNLPAITLRANSLAPSLPPTDAKLGQPSNSAANIKDCKCSKRSERHVHFLEDLGQEEQKLMHSTQYDMKNSKDHTGDSDYNFLISFLSQMKKMNDLQNLQFRARMCDMVLHILAPTISSRNNLPTVPPRLTAGPAVAQLEYRDKTDLILLQQPQSSIFPCRGRNEKNTDNSITINAVTSTSSNAMAP